MFKIQLKDGKFYTNKSGRVQHYKTKEQAKAKIERIDAKGAKIVECVKQVKPQENN